MRQRARRAGWAAGVLALLVPAALRADDSLSRPRIRPLDLGLYGRVSPPSTALDAVRFEESIEVVAERPKELNETMAVWWAHWDLSTGSIYGKGINFQNQGCPTCVNILPLVDKLVDAVRKKKD
jgi:hypothetical protein